MKNKSITVDCLVDFYDVKNDSALSDRIDVNKATISKWRKQGITTERQAVFEVISGGKLKADLSKYSAALKI